MQLSVQFRMIIVIVSGELMLIRPIHLARCSQVALGVNIEGTPLVFVSVVRQPRPVFIGELLLPCGDVRPLVEPLATRVLFCLLWRIPLFPRPK